MGSNLLPEPTQQKNLTTQTNSSPQMLPSLNSAIAWLNNAQFENGFVCKYSSFWRRIDLYPEITGYAISTYTALFKKFGNEEYLLRALRAAEAVVRIMETNGAIPGVLTTRAKPTNRVYMFDQGIMSNGLFDLATELDRLKHKEAGMLLEKALLSARFIVEKAQQGPLWREYTVQGEALDCQHFFIHVKCVLPLAKAYQLTHDETYIAAAIGISDHTVNNFFQPTGAFRLNQGHIWNRTHYHCYAVEGMIGLSEVVQDLRYHEAARSGSIFLQKYQKGNGGFWNRSSLSENDGLEDVPVAAQAINIWEHFRQDSSESPFEAEIAKASAYLDGLQYSSFSKSLDGGFPFTMPRRWNRRWACSWACIFYIDSTLWRKDS